jgi:hypothetical protein
LARALVEERLAAVNRIAAVVGVSLADKVENRKELLVIGRADRFAALEKRVRKLHNYSVRKCRAADRERRGLSQMAGRQVVGGAAMRWHHAWCGGFGGRVIHRQRDQVESPVIQQALGRAQGLWRRAARQETAVRSAKKPVC